MSDNRYPEETLGGDEDDGTMPENVDRLRQAVVGRRIVSAERPSSAVAGWGTPALLLTLDDGTTVQLDNTDDCCAYTELDNFLLDPAAVDHIITGVGTTEQYTVWHIYADFGDIMKLEVGWSCGNPFYYGYGFDIHVTEVSW